MNGALTSRRTEDAARIFALHDAGQPWSLADRAQHAARPDQEPLWRVKQADRLIPFHALAPVISASRRKKPRLRAELIDQLTGML
jgi:hypothetical protein